MTTAVGGSGKKVLTLAFGHKCLYHSPLVTLDNFIMDFIHLVPIYCLFSPVFTAFQYDCFFSTEPTEAPTNHTVNQTTSCHFLVPSMLRLRRPRTCLEKCPILSG